MIGMAIAKGLEERGQTGAIHMGTAFDAWYPGYVDYAPIFKNIPAFWTETAGNMAAPREYTLTDLPPAYRDLRPQSLYSSPWQPGWWRLGDAVAYNETASLAVLEYAAKYKESLLYNRYQAGRDQIARGKTDAPFAYVFPQDQRDPVAAVELLRRLAFGGVRVSQLTAPVDHGQRDVSGRNLGRPDRPGVRRDGPGACSMSRNIPTCANIRADRRCGPMTRPAGPCPCRWASNGRPSRRRSAMKSGRR